MRDTTDFANETDEIEKAFAPYYERTLLKEGTDPNLLYNLQDQLLGFGLYDDSDVERFARVYFSGKGTADKLHAALTPVVDRFRDAGAEEQVDFRGQLNDYIRLYAFLSQIITFIDSSLEKLYVFSRMLLRKLPVEREKLPVEIQRAIDIESYRVQQTSKGKISLERGTAELDPIGAKGAYALSIEELEALSRIIQKLNQRFGTDFSEEDKVFIRQLEQRLAGDAGLEASVRVNPPGNARLTFDHVVNDHLQDMIDTNFKFYKQVTDDPAFAKALLDWLFERYVKRAAEPAVDTDAEP